MRGETPTADTTITFAAARRPLPRRPRRSAATRSRSGRSATGSATRPPCSETCRWRRWSAGCRRSPPGSARSRQKSRYGIVQALRQALEAAVRWGHMTKNPAKLAGPNPQPKAEEIHPFTQAEIDLVAEELGPKYGPVVVFASETGMRPSEWLAIEWRDIDRKAGVVLVERTCAYGVTKSLREDRPEPSSGPAVDEGAGGAGRDSPPARRPARVPRRAGRGDRPQELPALTVEARARRRRDPAATDLRHAPLVRDVGARRRVCRSSTSPATWARRWR